MYSYICIMYIYLCIYYYHRGHRTVEYNAPESLRKVEKSQIDYI